MTDIDLTELRRIAEAATDGPWSLASTSDTGFAVHCGEHDTIALYARRDDARHIATFDPQTVLALLAEIERLRGVVERVEVVLGEQELHYLRYKGATRADIVLAILGRIRRALEVTP